MDNFIFNPTDRVDFTDTGYYCLIGSENYIDGEGYPRLEKDSKKVLAKKIIKTDSQPQYFIKISNNNKLFNPLGSGLEDKSYSICM